MPAPRTHLRLLGDFQLIVADHVFILGQPRLEELLTLLAVQPDIQFTRAQIAYLFWPESSEKQALANVRGLIHKLKKAWPDCERAVVIERGHLYWRREAEIAVDLHEFTVWERKAQDAEEKNRLEVVQQAVSLYSGDLVPACYSDWILTAREELHARYAALLDLLIDSAIVRGEYQVALHGAEALRRHDPLRESAYRRLMEIHTLLEDRAAALRVYHRCATLLQNELGIEPSPPLQELHQQLLNHTGTHADAPENPMPVDRPQMVGRHRERQLLQQQWRGVEQGGAHCVVIWGEAGIGKTRLAEEMIDLVRRMGHNWTSSRSYAARGALTYAPITEWLRSPSLAPALDNIDDLWRVEVARLMPELLAERPDLPAPGPLTENWQQQRFFQSIVQILLKTAGPLLLHLDDMQWSDQETLTLLHFILHGARARPLLLLGTIRTEDAVGNAPLASLLGALRHSQQLTELTLGPLTPDEVSTLACQTAGHAIDANVTERLYAESEGHPLFLIESVRGGLTPAGRELDTSHSSTTETSLPRGMPPKIFQLLSARLHQLSAQAQEIAGTAAVIGRAFNYPVLRKALALDELTLIDGLDELWTRRIIREQETDAYDFTHDRIRETAYQQLSRARRRLLHRRVAEALESIHSGELDLVAAELATQYAHAGESVSAYRYYRMAADIALAKYALTSAEELLRAALDHSADDPLDQIRIYIELNNIYFDTLEYSALQENLTRIEDLLEQHQVQDERLLLEAMLSRAHYLQASGKRKQGLDIVIQAAALAERLGDQDMLARAYFEMGIHYWMQTRMVDARSALEQCVGYAISPDSRPVLAKALEFLAATGMFTGMSAGRISTLLNQSLQLAEDAGDKRQISVLYNKFGYLPVAQGMGDFAAAEEAYRYGLAFAQEIGQRGLEETILANLVVLNYLRGDYRRALTRYRQAAELGQDEANRLFYWVKRHYRAAALIQMGNLPEAETELTAACAHLNELKSHHFEVKARCDLGLLHHLAGKQGAAHDELCLVLDLTTGHGDLRFEALINTRLGYVYEAMGQPQAALNAYAAGYDLHNAMEQHVYALNAKAGTARVLTAQGDINAGYAAAAAIWETLNGRETDATVETARTLRTCYTIFRRHHDERADAVLTAACTQLARRVASIDDPVIAADFWALDDHRFFAALRQEAAYQDDAQQKNAQNRPR